MVGNNQNCEKNGRNCLSTKNNRQHFFLEGKGLIFLFRQGKKYYQRKVKLIGGI
jgi:hypothetical protein